MQHAFASDANIRPVVDLPPSESPETNNFKTYMLLLALYGSEGLFYSIVVAMPAVLFQNFGASVSWITFYTGILALPWTFKVLVAPAADRAQNLRKPLLLSLAMCVLCSAWLASCAMFGGNQISMLIAFGLLGMLAATQENFVDRIYLTAFSKEQQTKLMWFRNTAFRLTYLLGAGLLISVAGYLNESSGARVSYGWGVALTAAATLSVVAFLAVARCLPQRLSCVPRVVGDEPNLIAAIKSFLRIQDLWKFLLYLSVFRLGDAMLAAVVQPFLLDHSSIGGLGMKTSQVGFIYGSLGAISLIVGGVCGGAAINRFGVRRLLIPFSLLQTCSIIAYLALAIYRPAVAWVGIANSFEQFAFGLTTACYSVVTLATVHPRFRATHFGFTCAFVNFGLLIPSMFSGQVVQHIGYVGFFGISVLLSLLGPCVSLVLPKNDYLVKPHST